MEGMDQQPPVLASSSFFRRWLRSALAVAPAAEGGVVSGWSVRARFAVLQAGLLAYGIGLCAMIRSDVGLAPWDAFHVGLSRQLPGVTIGEASIGVGVVFQTAAALFLRMPIGIGSVLNMFLLGFYIDWLMPWTPLPNGVFAAWALFMGGVVLVGLGTGTYIASGFGAGPRDSVSLGLARRTGYPVRYFRTVVEMLALAGGFLMGAKIGWGTLFFAVTIGPCMGFALRLYGLKK